LKVSEVFERLSEAVTKWTGGTGAFGIAVAVVVVWVAVGPIFHYSDTWQLVINTGTTIITFLMVFLIQRSQNKDALAIHLKLNEAEGLTEKELNALRRHYQELAALAAREADLTKSHSVEEAGKRHTAKKRGQAS
jgi:low affinity Fe/Cu permease